MFTITDTLVRSYAETHSAPRLRELIKEKQAELAKGTIITQVSGAGTSYQRTITMPTDKAIELFTLALELKEGRGASDTFRRERYYDPCTAC